MIPLAYQAVETTISPLQNIVYQAHSGSRWLVVAATVFAFLYVLFNFIQRRVYTQNVYRAMLVFSSLVGVQWALGILLFLVLGGFDIGYRWEHALTMTLALAVAHLYIPFKRRPDSLRYPVSLAVIVAALVIVYIGVARLPQGWMG